MAPIKHFMQLNLSKPALQCIGSQASMPLWHFPEFAVHGHTAKFMLCISGLQIGDRVPTSTPACPHETTFLPLFHAVTRHNVCPQTANSGLPFWRFATMCDSRTNLPPEIDAHKAISLVTVNYFARIVLRYDVDVVALIFEGSERGDKLVERDYNLASMDLKNMWGASHRSRRLLHAQSLHGTGPGGSGLDCSHRRSATSARNWWEGWIYEGFSENLLAYCNSSGIHGHQLRGNCSSG